MTTDIIALAKELKEAREKAHENRCSDGNCVLRDRSKPQGMITNGGCHCLDRVDPIKKGLVKLTMNKAHILAEACIIMAEALGKAHDSMGNAGQTAWDGNDELKRMILSGGRKDIREAIEKVKGLK